MVRLHWLLLAHGRNRPAIQGAKTLLHRLHMIAQLRFHCQARQAGALHQWKTITAGVFMALSRLLLPGKQWKTG